MHLEKTLRYRAYRKLAQLFESLAAAVFFVRSKNSLDNLAKETAGDLIKARIHTANGDHFSIYHRGTRADLGVIGQIFQDQDYNINRFKQGAWVQSAYRNIVGSNQRPVIIDAGANIGLSGIYLKNNFPESILVAVEPSTTNLKILQKNLNAIADRIIHGAIHSGATTIELKDPDEGEWGFSTHNATERSATSLETVKCFKFADLIENGEIPFILKVDIEGAEKGEFEDYRLLSRFALIVVELHDWLYPGDQTSTSFLKFAASENFDFCFRGENVFLFNRAFKF